MDKIEKRFGSDADLCASLHGKMGGKGSQFISYFTAEDELSTNRKSGLNDNLARFQILSQSCVKPDKLKANSEKPAPHAEVGGKASGHPGCSEREEEGGERLRLLLPNRVMEKRCKNSSV